MAPTPRGAPRDPVGALHAPGSAEVTARAAERALTRAWLHGLDVPTWREARAAVVDPEGRVRGPADVVLAGDLLTTGGAEARGRLLGACRAALGPRGVVVAWFDPEPAWFALEPVRQALRRATRHAAGPIAQRLTVRELVRALRALPAERPNPWTAWLDGALDALEHADDATLAHFLEREHHPTTRAAVRARAREAGLMALDHGEPDAAEDHLDAPWTASAILVREDAQASPRVHTDRLASLLALATPRSPAPLVALLGGQEVVTLAEVVDRAPDRSAAVERLVRAVARGELEVRRPG